MNLIEVLHVSKSFRKGFGWEPVLKDIDLTICKGEFVILRGNNGAGKSTLLNLIMGLLQPSYGEIRLMNSSPQLPESKNRVGVVLQEANVPKSLKVKELVQLVESYYVNPISTEEVLTKVNLQEKKDAWAASLSGGQKQRLYFALALIGNPELLILDEPTRNLDDEGYQEFWKQIKICREQEVTILMVTNNKADWEEINQLATRIVNLQKISEVSGESQLVEVTSLTRNISDQSDQIKAKGTPEKPAIHQAQNPSSALRAQISAEMLQLLRTPSFLFGIFLLAGLTAILPYPSESAKQPLVYLSGVILLTVAIDRLGGRIAFERAERWLKFLRTTPLSPTTYIIAKVFTTLVVCAFSLLSIFVLAIGKNEVQIDPNEILLISLSLILGVIPFAILSLSLSYLIDPKSYNSISAVAIIIGLLTCGSIPLPKPQLSQDLVAFSPFYHYRQLMAWSAGLDHDRQLWLHLLWLLWSSIAFGILALWAYKRDQVVL
jgi:ABC-2 type transport system ATP-binding protein